MHSIQLESHINEQGLLTLQLPDEWMNQPVNVIVIIEKKLESVTPPNWLGCMRGTGEITGDIISPAEVVENWKALQ